MVYVTQKYKFVLWRIKEKVLSSEVWRQLEAPGESGPWFRRGWDTGVEKGWMDLS